MIDTLETAYACGLGMAPRHAKEPKLKPAPDTLNAASFERIGNDWLALSYVLNKLNRSMGLSDAYPFTLSDAVMGKLAFVHRVVSSRRSSHKAAPKTETGQLRQC